MLRFGLQGFFFARLGVSFHPSRGLRGVDLEVPCFVKTTAQQVVVLFWGGETFDSWKLRKMKETKIGV